jgi:hypothetical protein
MATKVELPAVEIPLCIGEKLCRIQQEFKAKKSRFNSFGKYNFRSAEDILEGLKPMNEKYGVYFTINEQLINANPPVMTSVATIWDCESGKSIDCSAVVGIDLNQKGMQTPQAFGSASSYAKKYALGNLLLIDDTADADATNTHGKEAVKQKEDVKQTPYNEMKWLQVNTPEFDKAKNYLKGGGDIELIEKKYKLDVNVKQELLNNK